MTWILKQIRNYFRTPQPIDPLKRDERLFLYLAKLTEESDREMDRRHKAALGAADVHEICFVNIPQT